MPDKLPPWPSLSPWPHLLARLRAGLAQARPNGGPDIQAAVTRIATAQQLDRVPRLLRRQWGAAIQVIDDRSRRLVPLWHDQDEFLGWLMPLFPENSVDHWRCWDGATLLLPMDERNQHLDYAPPPAGTIVLVLGDLGCLDRSAQPLVQHWLEFGRTLRAAGCVPVALMPCAPHQWPASLPRVWHLIPWEGPLAPPSSNHDPAEQLLSLLSPAVRMEPGLLRQVRRLPGAGGFGVAAEVAAWQHGVITSQSSVAASLDAEGANRLRTDFAQYPADIQRLVLALIRDWRAGLSPDVWYEEILSLPATSTAHLPVPEERQRAIHRFRQLGQALASLDDPKRAAGFAMGLRGLLSRMPKDMVEPEIRQAMDQFWHFVRQWDGRANNTSTEPPSGFDPGSVAPRPDAVRQRLHLHHQGGHLRISPPDSAEAGGSPLATINSVNGLIAITGDDLPDPRASFWPGGKAPAWAGDWGHDRFGAWASFTIAGVTQRMRWMAPGRFRMGSPADEPGRYDDEGPVHEVTISKGFWLFDTPCTQALWQAVMGDNPSRFQSPDRPVEQVSWDGAQGFIKRLNSMIPGLSLSLPTEAQWEYACRAGTETALYTGPIDIKGEHDAPALDPIAWYGGNCGQGFELRNGHDISDWNERQYPDTKGGTHPVGMKAPNGWGLYDMLGNVLEWCADGNRDYSTGSLLDPIGETKRGALRSLRGGSWIYSARVVRAACRFWGRPDDRRGIFGFRCAQGQDGPEGGAERSLPQSPRLAERRGAAGMTGPRPGTSVVEVGGDAVLVPMPATPALIIRSDCEELHLAQIARPDWASAIGRDRFGLWTRIDVAGARQRLRWMAPGRFLMGSPEDEPRRWDDEGPVHEVTISKGFWLFDTPCTQALWRAVMGDNPSRFQSPDRPVEQVSWHDTQGFITRINSMVPGLSLSLPTESQWEYACRAGTDTALYTGPIEIDGDDKATALDPIAWYGGNSEGETHPVGMKAPNGWGLYDMLGNVWEWCANAEYNYGSGSMGETEDGALRSLRGGSWDSAARLVRAACRCWVRPDVRLGNFGFRCAQGQAGPEGGAERSLPQSPRLAERRGAAGMIAPRPGKTPATKKRKK
ncbi:formylglycine-generating enzyme family protein [Niveispirillum sp. SYP-B3756]|uniref:formylglycine-generating enzyme family protein n=1 Tax=Niveispirillum sp. SYP-B3756 TaxID=2662178 RepID=UPI001B3BF0EC|nr:formylglycine-generating enzyme family protein [Niveispirillum sp. SYP-B3756]